MTSKFETAMRKAFEEWESEGKCSEALKLNQYIGEAYFDVTNPHFYTGDFTSKLVLVHLNPKRNVDNDEWGLKCIFPDFNVYTEYYKRFGYIKYQKEREEGKIHKSPFDHKQIRFLKPFGVLLFTGDKYNDLELVIDSKLQLELIPYGSPDFNSNKFRTEDLMPFTERILDLIGSKGRDYVIFCGRVFYKILCPFIVKEKEFEFKLQKTNGKETINQYQIKNIQLVNGINATIAPQFARQGCPVDKYGEKIKEYYGKFD